MSETLAISVVMISAGSFAFGMMMALAVIYVVKSDKRI
nr:MAG TPA: hypothetical protein [Caudoviricetes sp.]